MLKAIGLTCVLWMSSGCAFGQAQSSTVTEVSQHSIGDPTTGESEYSDGEEIRSIMQLTWTNDCAETHYAVWEVQWEADGQSITPYGVQSPVGPSDTLVVTMTCTQNASAASEWYYVWVENSLAGCEGEGDHDSSDWTLAATD